MEELKRSISNASQTSSAKQKRNSDTSLINTNFSLGKV